MKLAAIVVVVAGCQFSDVGVAGKACPCPSDYSCVANVCVEGNVTPDAHTEGPDTARTCIQNPIELVVYQSATFSEYPTGFTQIGNGVWTTTAQGVHQGNETASLAAITLSANPGDLANQNYRVQATIRQSEGADGGAYDVALRMNAANKTMYQCGLAPNASQIVFARTEMAGGGTDLGRLDLAGIDPNGSYILEAQAVGSNLQCCIRGVANAYVNVTDATYATGTPGLKTFVMAADFSAFTVYQ